jgi:hypothetical protein
MADISEYIDNNITIKLIENAIERNNKKNNRGYLGMSEIGHECWRYLWYNFRKVSQDQISASGLMAIEDGYRQEELTAERLRMVHGIKLKTTDELDHQIGFKYLGGHFSGHCDGMIEGIVEAPKTKHIWEHKSVNEKKFKELNSLILDIGEKSALEAWDEIYYAQAQIYMLASNLDRHYLTVSTPGGRALTSCRTEIKKKIGESLLEKAHMIITSERPPAKLNENREYYICRWCRKKSICHDNEVPDVNCKTCAFSEPILEGTNAEWKCYKKNCNISGEMNGCEQHLFLNTLIPLKAIAADESGTSPSWIKYDFNGTMFYNINSDSKKIPGACLTSEEMRGKIFFECIFNDDKIKSEDLKIKKSEKENEKLIRGIL